MTRERTADGASEEKYDHSDAMEVSLDSVQEAQSKPAIYIRSRPTVLVSNIDPAIDVFVGREAELRQLQNVLGLKSAGEFARVESGAAAMTTTSSPATPSSSLAKRAVLINAFGGAGKTMLAIQFGNIAKRSGYSVRWFDGGKIASSYRDMALGLNVVIEGSVSDRDVREMVNIQLSRLDQQILFIFDNMDHASYLDAWEYIRQLPDNVRLVITSQERDLEQAYTQKKSARIELKEFSHEEALQYLELSQSDSVRLTSRDKALLIGTIGLLPLRLSLAMAALHSNSTMSPADYVAHFERMKKDGKPHIESDIVLGKLFNKEDARKAEWLALQYCAYLDPEFIPFEIFYDKNSDSGLISTAELVDTDKAFWSFSIASTIVNSDGVKGFKLSNFIQTETIAYAVAHPDQSIVRNAIITTLTARINSLCPEVTDNPGDDWQKSKLLLGNAIKICNDYMAEAEVAVPRSKDSAELLSKIGDCYYHVENDPSKSLEYYQRSLRINTALYSQAGENHIEIAKCLRRIGDSYKALGNYTEAQKYHAQSLKMCDELYPEQNHQETIKSLSALGQTYCKLAEHNKALECQQRAIAMCHAHHGKNHADTARLLCDSVWSYIALNDYTKAKECGELALKICNELYHGQNHLCFAYTLNTMGVVRSILNDHEGELSFFEQSLRMCELIYSKQDHPKVAQLLHNISVSYANLGNYLKSIEYDEKALALRLALYPGKPHVDIALSLYGIGVAYERLGEHRRALEYKERALTMRLELYPDQSHLDIAHSFYGIGFSHAKLGDYRKALAYYERSLSVRLTLDPSSPRADIANLFRDLGVCYGKIAMGQKALEYHHRALTMFQDIYPDQNHPDIVTSLNDIVEACKMLGHKKNALNYREQALAMSRALSIGHTSPSVLKSRHHTDNSPKNQNRVAFSEQYVSFDKALEVVIQLANIKYGSEKKHEYSDRISFYKKRIKGKRICVADALKNPDGTEPTIVSGCKILKFFDDHPDLMDGITIANLARMFELDLSEVGAGKDSAVIVETGTAVRASAAEHKSEGGGGASGSGRDGGGGSGGGDAGERGAKMDSIIEDNGCSGRTVVDGASSFDIAVVTQPPPSAPSWQERLAKERTDVTKSGVGTAL